MKIIIKKIVFIMLFVVLGTTACNNSSNNEMITSIPSPNGKYIAYIFIRDMGATTKESYQLSILKKGNKLGNSSGNIFVSYGTFEVEWKNDKELLVKNNSSEEEFKKMVKCREIKIKYTSDSR